MQLASAAQRHVPRTVSDRGAAIQSGPVNINSRGCPVTTTFATPEERVRVPAQCTRSSAAVGAGAVEQRHGAGLQHIGDHNTTTAAPGSKG